MQTFAIIPAASKRITIMAMSRHVNRNATVFLPLNAQLSANSKVITINFYSHIMLWSWSSMIKTKCISTLISEEINREA